MRFFFDNCVAPRIARAISVLSEGQDCEIVHLRDRFRDDTKDPVWIRALGEEGDWIIVSGDPRITRGRAEQEAWRESRLTAFFFGAGWASKQRWKQAADLVEWWPRITLAAKSAPPGTGHIIPLNGKEFQKVYLPESRG